MHAAGIAGKLFTCADCTFDSLKAVNLRSYAPKGGGQPQHVTPKKPYTNCFYTNLFSDGDKTRTPTLMYTHDPYFKPGSNHWPRVEEIAAELGIQNLARIRYEESTRKYHAADNSVVYDFIRFYNFEGNIVVTDQGNEFKRGGVDVLEEWNNTRMTMAPVIHHIMSMLDHGVFGPAKRQWRNSGVDFSDRILSPLKLLSIIDATSKEKIKHYFTRNFLLDKHTITREDCLKVIKPQGKNMMKRSSYYAACLTAYEEEILHIEKIDGDIVPKEVLSELDGEFWN